MNFNKLINQLIRENEEQETKQAKGALLTVRLPFAVKDDLEKVAKERGLKMTPVVEGYFVAAKAMERIQVKLPRLHDAILNASSPEEIEQILQRLISKEMPLESVVEENFLQTLKDRLTSATINVKSALSSLSKFFAKLMGEHTTEAGLPLLSDLLFVYAKNH